ncbi:MAG: thioredoxin-disulfide reductase [Bacteroidales bacterium]|jgi:thioredoxin reductase (NADPH)|nr:thioredoxin-disulfide reductase [Bacteroidales bacterium]
MKNRIKCMIIGSGPAGYTSAIYAARADLNPVLFEGIQPGGQLTITTEVENFPGYPQGVSGVQMMQDLKQQAQRFGTEIRNEIVERANLSSHPFKVETDKGNFYLADTIIIATGASARWLGLESEKRLMGMGVSACATCDGFFYRNQVVGVVGGGDTACEEASYLSNICKKVYLIVRRDVLRASKTMQERVLRNEKIEIVWQHKPIEILGDDSSGVSGVRLENTQNGEQKQVELSGIFIAIGHTPNTEIFKGQIDLDNEGYIITKGGSSHTNIEGVFAAGDVQDTIYKQAITAAASGCRAAIDAERFLCEHKG